MPNHEQSWATIVSEAVEANETFLEKILHVRGEDLAGGVFQNVSVYRCRIRSMCQMAEHRADILDDEVHLFEHVINDFCRALDAVDRVSDLETCWQCVSSFCEYLGLDGLHHPDSATLATYLNNRKKQRADAIAEFFVKEVWPGLTKVRV